MNNPYAVTTQFLVDLFESNPLVNTIIFGVDDEIDLYKKNIFPLVHIIPGNWDLVENRIEMEFEIVVVSIRNHTNKPVTTKIFSTNLIDNLSQSLTIISTELTKLELQRNEFDIVLESSQPAQPITDADKNLLDGFSKTIVLSIQNEFTDCE